MCIDPTYTMYYMYTDMHIKWVDISYALYLSVYWTNNNRAEENIIFPPL